MRYPLVTFLVVVVTAVALYIAAHTHCYDTIFGSGCFYVK